MPRFGVSLINFAVWTLEQSSNFLGMADLTMPVVEQEVASIKGAGVLGTIDYPILGHTGDITATFNFHTPNRDAISFLRQRGRQLDCRGAVEIYDSGSGAIEPESCRMVMTTLPKSVTFGTFEVAAPTGTSAVVAVVALTVYLGDDRVFEHDKFNIKWAVDGDEGPVGDVRRILGY
jgi:phage tail tube protein FII